MSNVENSVTARLKKQEHSFEILVNCEKAMQYKRGDAELDEALVTDAVFKDIKKGEHASETDLVNIFGTDDKRAVAEVILKKGEIQLTTEYKSKLREEKKKKIAFIISQYAVNPQNNLPHPLERIESVMDERKVKIEEFKSAEGQVESIISELKEILPISYEIKKLNLVIPADASGRSFGIIKKYSKILKEEWLGDGRLSVNVEVPAGLQEGLFNDLNNIAHGQIESKEMK
ncbi:ribosome assembly factor SBDS [Candidatus Woesearchaeota archaeon]|nr:ribosome assembly factor SBDS [Candidatus Woesearchaeota archaeon]MBT4321642.1 ribosome assembly factor SBDS [Candidatus Woesearchaeota archaeon]MBT4631047.1 ribosome assembly factor SBDS [Candidatus Woesearchaeota archaeon]